MAQNGWRKIEKYLSKFPDMSLQMGQPGQAPIFSLINMKLLASKVGNPELKFPSVHVAGTNGKGSVVSICASVLGAAGYKVGQYTSPHYGESLAGIAINNEAIQPSEALHIIDELEKVSPSIPALSRFEIESMIAYVYFSQAQVDIAVIEVGLGGRLDATNIIEPILSVITSIDFEHQTMLGNSLEEIAVHKAGIIQTGAPLILAPQNKEVRDVLLREARKENADVVEMGIHFDAEVGKINRNFQTINISYDDEQVEVMLGLLGHFQIENAALAYAALHKLGELGFSINRLDIQEGFSSVQWPGRFELIEKWDRIFVLDAAHTPVAAQTLANSINDYFPKEVLVGIFGISNDKQPSTMLKHFHDRLSRLIATQSKHPRAMQSHSLEKIILENGFNNSVSENSLEAIEKAVQLSEKGKTILVFGSVFLIAEIREILIKNK